MAKGMNRNGSELNFKEALKKAQLYCSRQEICVSEMLKKLNDWGIDPGWNDKIVELLIAESFINEIRYASAFINDKIRFNKWGKYKIKYMLVQKGISASIINQAIEGIDEEEYVDIIKSEIIKKAKTLKLENRYLFESKLIQFGQGRGYEIDIVRKIASGL